MKTSTVYLSLLVSIPVWGRFHSIPLPLFPLGFGFGVRKRTLLGCALFWRTHEGRELEEVESINNVGREAVINGELLVNVFGG
jgi:hypothetical protein